jgi:hypothetical protein
MGLFSKDDSGDTGKRLSSVAACEDQTELAEIARVDESPRVRMAAVAKVSDQDLLYEVALDGKHDDSRVAAAERIDSEEKLAELIKVRKNYHLMGACFARITNPKILERIAHDPNYNMAARRMAIENYADESYLSELSSSPGESGPAKSPEEIKALVEKYGAPTLARTLGKFRGSPSAMNALGQIMRTGGEGAAVAVENLAQALTHGREEVRQAAADELAKLNNADLIAKLVGMMDRPGLHGPILNVLRKIDHPEARQVVESAEGS